MEQFSEQHHLFEYPAREAAKPGWGLGSAGAKVCEPMLLRR
jgi:hypothetical protein